MMPHARVLALIAAACCVLGQGCKGRAAYSCQQQADCAPGYRCAEDLTCQRDCARRGACASGGETSSSSAGTSSLSVASTSLASGSSASSGVADSSSTASVTSGVASSAGASSAGASSASSVGTQSSSAVPRSSSSSSTSRCTPTLTYVNTLPLAGEAVAIAAGDLNRDNVLDLVVGTKNANGLVILSGSGDGRTFADATATLTSPPSSVAVLDLTGDDFPDVVAVMPSFNTLLIYQGNGSGSLSSLPSVTTSSQPREVLGVDTSGEGNMDLLLVYPSGTVGCYLGNGAGAFTVAPTIGVGTNPGHMSLGRVNNERVVLLALDAEPAPVHALRLVAGGFVVLAALGTWGDHNVRVLQGDVDGNGVADLVLGSSVSPGLRVVLNENAGVFPAESTSRGVTDTLVDVALQDLNGDHLDDVIVLTSTPALEVYLGQPDGTLAVGPRVQLAAAAGAMLLADLDGDGFQDVAVAASTAGVILFRGACQ